MKQKKMATKFGTPVENIEYAKYRIKSYQFDDNLSEAERNSFKYAVQQLDYALDQIKEGDKS